MLRQWIIGNNGVNVLRQMLHKTSTHHQEPRVLFLCFLYLLFYSQSDAISSLPFYESQMTMDSVTCILNGKRVSTSTANIHFGESFCCNTKTIIDGIMIVFWFENVSNVVSATTTSLISDLDDMKCVAIRGLPVIPITLLWRTSWNSSKHAL